MCRRSLSKRMRAFLRVSLLTIVCLLANVGIGATVPPLTGRLVDTAHVLSAKDAQRVEAALTRFEQSTGGQLVILIEEHIPEGESLEGWTLKVAETWKLGHQGNDNGALLYLAMKDRRNRLEVGYGWEGFITDARAGDVLRAMAPALREDDTKRALFLAIQQLHLMLTGKPLSSLPLPTPRERKQARLIEALPPLAILVLLLFLSIRYPRFGQFMILLLSLFGRSSGGRGGSGGGFRGGGGGFGGGGASGRW